MAVKDLFDEPFDENTIAKLEIFEDYAEAWLPVFIVQSRSPIGIYDFFAGAGYDNECVPGSPIRLLRQIKKQVDLLVHYGSRINLYLNAYDPDRNKSKAKYESLMKACQEYIAQHPGLESVVDVKYYNEDATVLFDVWLPFISADPALVYLDQNGIKFLSDRYLLALEKLKETDFLYYASSSYFWRLGDQPEFKAHVTVDMERLKAAGYERVHSSMLEQLREKLPQHSKLKLYPFSIRKEQNIFGIIFGAKHPLAVDKFLNIAWKKNSVNGEANFDIDGDAIAVTQMNMFEQPKLKKVDRFKANVKAKVLNKTLSTNSEVLAYAYSEGHFAKHANDVLREMKKEGLVTYDSQSPLVSYEHVFKNRNILQYEILNN